MFVSFFPKPQIFFWSAVLWTAVAIAGWYSFGDQLGAAIGLPPAPEGAPPIIGTSVFWSPPFLWFYIYYALVVAIFAAFWMIYAPHPWARWSILGSALIVFATYYSVQVSVALNNWYGPFGDMIQAALSKSRVVTIEEFYGVMADVTGLLLVFIVVYALTRFFISHYTFRWRTAMNDYYMANWATIRSIEGASQRVQDDTMRFAQTVEGLGANFVDASHDSDRFSSGPVWPVKLRNRTAHHRANSSFPCHRCDCLVGLRNDVSCRRRYTIARALLSQPAG